MISVSDALSLVLAQGKNFEIEEVDLLNSNGRVLAQDVVADRDFPPFNRATMDGIAIDTKAFKSGTRSFPIESVQAAGEQQKQLNNENSCIEVMTGAILPVNTDTVIRYEDVAIQKDIADVGLEEINAYQNVHLKGTDAKKGDVLISSNIKITPGIIGAMASVGMHNVKVYCNPRVAVCSTGDELVEVNKQPELYQIRQSNSYMLLADLQQQGIMATRYHLPDDAEEMTEQLTSIIENHDVILLSGAVSKGRFDFLPQVLKDLGMETIFHGIAQKPGKPFLLGKLPDATLVFAFPGNPVSTWVCYQLYFKAWLNKSLKQAKPTVSCYLGKSITFPANSKLGNHVLVKLNFNQEKLVAMPVSSSTSGDMVSLTQAEGLISFDMTEKNIAENSIHTVLVF